MSQNLRKKAARGMRRQSNGVSPLAVYVSQGTPVGSRQNTSDEDFWSETSGDTVDSWGSAGSRDERAPADEVVNWEDDIVQAIQDLEEKRSSTREEALTKLERLLSQKYSASLLWSRRETLFDLLARSLKKEKSYKESKLAAKVMSLMFITLGESQEAMYNDTVPLLKYTTTNTASVGVKSACIKTLALACFVAGSQADAPELLQFFTEIIVSNGKSVKAPNEGSVVAAALNAYGLLYAGLWGGSKRVDMRARDEFERVMPLHVKQLESSAVEVRMASGENIALMFETLGMGRRYDPAEDWGAEADVESDGSDHAYSEMDHLTSLLNNLATDSNRRRNKAERKVQRSAFRDILRTVEEGDGVREKLKIKRQTIYFSSWAKIVQLNALRDVLAEGLHVHFVENDLLQALFDFTPPPPIVKSSRPGSRPGSALSVHTAGSDSDASNVSRKQLARSKKRSTGRKNRCDFLEVG